MYTKGPWKIIESGRTGKAIIGTSQHEALSDPVICVLDTENLSDGFEENLANARRIVLCVNTHDELLEALEYTLHVIKDVVGYRTTDDKYNEKIRKVYAAVAKARGE